MNMQTIKGRILEIEEDSVIILTCQGEFIQRPLPQGEVQVGDEIDVTIRQTFRPRFGPLLSAGSAAAVIGCLLFQSIAVSAAPAYYVHLDIDPGIASVELALSNSMRVLEATPLNDEGTKILSEASLTRKPVGSAIKDLVNTANDLEYISPNKDSTVLISVAGVSKNCTEIKKKQVYREVQTAAKSQLQSVKKNVTLGVATVDASTRKQALDKRGSINSLLKNQHTNKIKKLPKEYEVSKVIPRSHKSVDNVHNSKNIYKDNTKNHAKNSPQGTRFKNNIQQQKRIKSLSPVPKKKESHSQDRSKAKTQLQIKIHSTKTNQSFNWKGSDNWHGKSTGNSQMKKTHKVQDNKKTVRLGKPGRLRSSTTNNN